MSVSLRRCADWLTNACFRARFPGPFHYVPGRDGVDETFDVYCLTSDRHLCSTHYWYERQRAELEARLFTAALNLPLLGGPNPHGVTPRDLLAFRREYAGPYVSRRNHCDLGGPGYDVADLSGDDPVVFVRGRNREILLITRQIATSLNRLYEACSVTWSAKTLGLRQDGYYPVFVPLAAHGRLEMQDVGELVQIGPACCVPRQSRPWFLRRPEHFR